MAETIKKPINIVEELTELAVDSSRCYLCGKAVPKAKQFNEYVVPKWMMDEYDLWHSLQSLAGRPDIVYGDKKVTTCADCHKLVRELDNEVKRAMLNGPDAVRALPQERLFLWLAKLYHSFFLSDAQLLLNPAHPAFVRGIFDYQSTVYNYTLNYLLLKKLLGQVEWSDFPASIFVFEALDGEERGLNFDYFDSADEPFVSLRCGKTLIIATLQDFGAVSRYEELEQWPQIATADQLKLHPLQCKELFVVFRTLNLSTGALQLGITSDGQKYYVDIAKPSQVEGLPTSRPWDGWKYSNLFRSLFKNTLNMAIVSPHGDNCTPTLMLDADDQPLQAPHIEAEIVQYVGDN
jgi:hypothetical protein